MTTIASKVRPITWSRASRVRKSRSPFRAAVMVLTLPAVLIALWWIISSGSTNPFFPPLSKIMETFAPTWGMDRLITDVVPSVRRLLIGYLLALFIGISLGITIGSYRRLRLLLEPITEFFRAIPAPVMVPVLMLLFGIDDTMKIAVIAIGCLWPILLNAIEGVRSVDSLFFDTAKVYKLRPLTLVRLLLRGASPQIVAGARQALSIGIILMVISEMFAANNGLGFTIVQFRQTFAVPQMWTGIILLGLLGISLSLIFRVFERITLAWYQGLRQSTREGN